MRIFFVGVLGILFFVGCKPPENKDPLDEELVTPEEKEAIEEYTDGSFRKG